MKKCLLCGTIDESGTSATCPMDGEASWGEIASIVETVIEAAQSESEAPKRGRGRPKGS